jgi:hypothetical protein
MLAVVLLCLFKVHLPMMHVAYTENTESKESYIYCGFSLLVVFIFEDVSFVCEIIHIL